MSLSEQQWCPTSVQVTVQQARGLRAKGKSGTNDAYAVMQVGKEKFQTSVVEKSVAPVWKEEAAFDLPLQGGGGGGGGAERSTLHVHVLHRALVGPDKLLGQAVINLLLLSEDRSRNKTEWFKLLDKTGKPDKDRGEVLVDIQFMRTNMTASMCDLSGAGKSKSRMGKFKDKVRGKKKESDATSNMVPSFSQVLTDSEEEGNGDGEGKGEKKKKHRMKSLFSPKSNLQKNMSQSMSVLPGKNSSLSSSQSSGLNVEPSEGKKKFKFMIHKRSGSSDSKDSSSSHQKHCAAEQSNVCINGSHVYCEEPPPRTLRIGSNFSLASSGHGSMEEVPENSPPSVDSLRAVRQYSPWTEEEEEMAEVENMKEEEEKVRMEQERRRKDEEERKTEEEKLKKEEEERIRMEEEERKLKEEEERVRREEEERERLAEEKRSVEQQEMKRMEEEKRQREEEERAEEEKRRKEEEERVRREEEERERLAEEKKRLEEEERKRIEEEKVKKEEEERVRREEEERKQQEEEERVRREEERERLAKQRRRVEEQEIKRIEEKRQREQEERRKGEEERVRREEEERERLAEETRRLEEQERRQREEEERIRIEEERRKREEEEYKEKKRLEEQEKRQREERIRMEEEGAQEERRRREEEERRIREEKVRKEEEERIRREEERAEEEEMMRRQEEEREEKRRLEEQEMRQREEEEIRKKEEERRRKEKDEEEKARREKEEFERLVKEKRKQEEEERKRVEAEERVRREEEQRRQKEEEKRILEEQERRRIEEEERRQREEEERIMKEEVERARKEKEEYERLLEEKRRQEEQERRRREEEEKAEKERKEEEARKLEKEKLMREAEEQKKKEVKTTQKAAGNKPKVPAEVTSTNPFDEDISNNPFEELPDSSTRVPSAASPVGSKTISTGEKDPISTQRERRHAPQPPGRNQAERASQREQDASTPHLAQTNNKSKDKDVKTVSVLPQRSVQMIAPLSRSPTDAKDSQSNATKGASNAVKHSKGPAPLKPPPGGNVSHECISEAKQAPIVYGLNPFEDDEDESVAQDDTPTSGNTDSVKIKSPKARAPPVPTKKDAASTNQNTEGNHATGDTGVTVPDNGPRDPESKAVKPVHVQEAPLQESQPAAVQTAAEEMGGKKEGPPVTSRRLQPVKPLNPVDQQSVTVIQGEKDNKPTGILCEVQDKTKVNDTRLKGPYSQLTQEELISLVLKQENQLSQRDKKISELELYIDNLLVRVMEENPTILMSLNSMKKAA